MKSDRKGVLTSSIFNRCSIFKIIGFFLLLLGSLFLLFLLLAFTSAPFWIWYGLGTAKADISGPPDCIVVLGGSGIPSETGLMRTWYAARAADHFPEARVIVALPGDAGDSLSSIKKMCGELILRGVAPERILTEDSGTNTRAQALLVREMLMDTRHAIWDPESGILDQGSGTNQSRISYPVSRILIITSPEHLYRAVLTFRKAGFEQVDGLPAFPSDIEAEISFSARKLGGRRWVPDVGESITLRYQFWTQLQYEILILREWMAIAYYWLMGWI